MVTEKLEMLAIDMLKKKEREANKLMIASLLIFLVCFIVLYIIRPSLIGVTITILAPMIISIRERNRIFKVLIERIEKQDKEIHGLKAK